MRGLGKVDMKRGQTDRDIYIYVYPDLDIATTRKNRPKGRFFENMKHRNDKSDQKSPFNTAV